MPPARLKARISAPPGHGVMLWRRQSYGMSRNICQPPKTAASLVFHPGGKHRINDKEEALLRASRMRSVNDMFAHAPMIDWQAILILSHASHLANSIKHHHFRNARLAMPMSSVLSLAAGIQSDAKQTADAGENSHQMSL